MAVTVIQDFPATVEQYDKVNEALDTDSNMPDGLIIHVGNDMGNGNMRVIDIWESEDAWNKFMETRLGPAVVEVMGPMEGDPPPIEVKEVHDLVKP